MISVQKQTLGGATFVLIKIPEHEFNMLAEFKDPYWKVWSSVDAGRGETVVTALRDFIERAEIGNRSEVGYCGVMISSVLPELRREEWSLAAQIATEMESS